MKNKTINILKLTALGLTSAEIAKEMFLSSRGVDYHLEIAKEILGAKNKANLIYLATNQGLI
ncbi:helix-turn-helix transcriptional regulator [Ferrimonas kyonanensis]|uniref:helix-turn-helix transcriptional regulator n=1 Tax=Ferrimonas kyonanensis TaxID=364763 RepID=UPI000486EFF0|nr:LuxR C-terminal-related transcriptional regulator [Ferrimonas kyonanensis]